MMMMVVVVVVFRYGGRLRRPTELRLGFGTMLPAGLEWLRIILLLIGRAAGAELEGNERHLQTHEVRNLKVMAVTLK